MRTYIIKRILISIVILIFVTLIIYTLVRFMPGSYVETMAIQLSSGPNAKSYDEWLAQLNAAYGLDKPFLIGWATWVKEFFSGNVGDSWKYTVPVLQKFKEVIGVSFVMGVLQLVLELVIAVPLGILAATRQYSRLDYGISAAARTGISLPTFFFAAVLKLVFAVKLGGFDTHGLVGRNFMQLSAIGKVGDMANHLVLPMITLVIISIGGLMRYTRTNMLEVMNADYIRTARAKGLSEKKVIYHHAFRNTLIPLVTMVGGSLPSLFSGALITETLFSIPGIGFTSYTAMLAGDIPFTMFYLTFLAILTLAGNLIADILYAVVDPRVRLG